jgi:hypothetical protein
MGAVGRKDIFVTAQTTQEGKSGVKKKGPEQQDASYGQTGILLRRHHRQGRKGETQKGAAYGKARSDNGCLMLRPTTQIVVMAKMNLAIAPRQAYNKPEKKIRRGSFGRFGILPIRYGE